MGCNSRWTQHSNEDRKCGTNSKNSQGWMAADKRNIQVDAKAMNMLHCALHPKQ